MRRLRLEVEKKVSARHFRKAFCKEWQQRVTDPAKKQQLLDAFQERRTWTDYMLGKKQDALLRRIADALPLRMVRERYTLDTAYYDTDSNLLEVLVEHENGRSVQKEMWKLLMWRAPLKVLIFYDQPEEDWLTRKLAELFEMGKDVDGHWPEASNAEYLFLVGQTLHQGEVPVWRYWHVADGNWPDRPSSGRRLKC